VNNFYEFFETFKERNIFRDDQLAELVERAQGILGGQSAEAIRSNDQLKEHVRAGMAEVEKAMAEMLSMPRRQGHHELSKEEYIDLTAGRPCFVGRTPPSF